MILYILLVYNKYIIVCNYFKVHKCAAYTNHGTAAHTPGEHVATPARAITCPFISTCTWYNSPYIIST